ncbi:amylo-alpha-1,6-glucosidase, partial [Micromonospora globispora]|uniref:glycogen debranching enzyme N-terminal domain-containing protein n=1 Tax=Micromonospora globispora TaxID=1450148 RepID=UPI000D9BA935
MIDIRFGPQVCGDPTTGSSREWLVPDGRGGYAMGTVSGLRTRRYHGLLVVAGETPAARRVGLVSLDPAVILPSGERVRLGAHEWSSGEVDPRGFELLEQFALIDGVPRWRWRVGDVVIERELAMAYGRSCVAVVHRLVSGGPIRLDLAAVCTWRDAHGERRADGPTPRMDPVAGGAVVEGSFRLAGPDWTPEGQWWLGVRHRE